MVDEPPLFDVRGLHTHFDQSANVAQSIFKALLRDSIPSVRAVDGVDITLEENQVQGVIGESGCGKTTLLETLVGLTEITDGEILFDGQPMSDFSKSDWKEFRRRVQIIFQNPFNSLNPKFTVRETLKEPLSIHGMERKDERIEQALDRAELRPPEKYLNRTPDQLSGGEKQRISIARALVLEPDVLLADEPLSMLDVSTQAAVLNLLRDLTDELDVSMLYISHDLSTVSYICDRINVMYLGRIIERAPTKTLLDDPKHPYTRALVNAIPIPDPHYDRERTALTGSPGDPVNIPSGCRFKDRCPERMEVCEEDPLMWSLEDVDQEVACHLYYDHYAVTEENQPEVGRVS